MDSLTPKGVQYINRKINKILISNRSKNANES